MENEDKIKEEVIEETKTEVKKKEKKKSSKEKIQLLEDKINALEEKVLREKAELINYRTRKDEEVTRMLKYSNESITKNLLPILDSFERAISMEHKIEDPEVEIFLEGFVIIKANLKKLLENYEVKAIIAIDEKFDPTYHQAVMTAKVDNVEVGIVVEELQKGYTYKDRVLRPSMVKVSE